MNPMTPAELRVAIASLGVTQAGLGSTIGITTSTVHAYLSGQNPIPMPTAILIRILVANRRWGELLTVGYGGK